MLALVPASAYICYEFLGDFRAYIFTVTLTITRTLIVIRVFMGSVYNYTTLVFSVRVYYMSVRVFDDCLHLQALL